MKVTVEFESLEEINDFCAKVWIGGLDTNPKPTTEKELTKTAKKAEETINRVEKAEEIINRAEAKEEVKKAAPKVDLEDLRVQAREALGTANKVVGTNIAKTWIKETGFKTLSDIEDPDILTKLIERAQNAG